MTKIGIVGVGAVGSTFLYACLNRNFEANYILIDAFQPYSEAQAKDLNDAACAMASNGSVFCSGSYNDLKDAKIVVITASVKPKNDKLEDRMELLNDNAKLIKEIAENIKKSGFQGITIIASNPVDLMACIYKQVTKFDANKVISSGTILETARMKKFLSSKLNVKASSINGFVIGEHGSRCIVPYEKIRVGFSSLNDFLENKLIEKNYLNQLLEDVKNEAFVIISNKGITNFGIGESLAEITSAIIYDTQAVYSLGVELTNDYKAKGIYFGLPVILGRNGYKHLPKIELNRIQQKEFDNYSLEIKETAIRMLKDLKIDYQF
ncbi:lactate/malate family dehydrogenase [Metamycoplasma buccale]|uniref:lactate/malate family dehydrogenase n=1 Tax=Metamycoplasma buccale TaxID=55602 RepID=UPI00398EAB41